MNVIDSFMLGKWNNADSHPLHCKVKLVKLSRSKINNNENNKQCFKIKKTAKEMTLACYTKLNTKGKKEGNRPTIANAIPIKESQINLGLDNCHSANRHSFRNQKKCDEFFCTLSTYDNVHNQLKLKASKNNTKRVSPRPRLRSLNQNNFSECIVKVVKLCDATLSLHGIDITNDAYNLNEKNTPFKATKNMEGRDKKQSMLNHGNKNLEVCKLISATENTFSYHENSKTDVPTLMQDQILTQLPRSNTFSGQFSNQRKINKEVGMLNSTMLKTKGTVSKHQREKMQLPLKKLDSNKYSVNVPRNDMRCMPKHGKPVEGKSILNSAKQNTSNGAENIMVGFASEQKSNATTLLPCDRATLNGSTIDGLRRSARLANVQESFMPNKYFDSDDSETERKPLQWCSIKIRNAKIKNKSVIKEPRKISRKFTSTDYVSSEKDKKKSKSNAEIQKLRKRKKPTLKFLKERDCKLQEIIGARTVGLDNDIFSSTFGFGKDVNNLDLYNFLQADREEDIVDYLTIVTPKGKINGNSTMTPRTNLLDEWSKNTKTPTTAITPHLNDKCRGDKQGALAVLFHHLRDKPNMAKKQKKGDVHIRTINKNGLIKCNNLKEKSVLSILQEQLNKNDEKCTDEYFEESD